MRILVIAFMVTAAGCLGAYSSSPPLSSSDDMAGAHAPARDGGAAGSAAGAADMSPAQAPTDLAQARAGDMGGGDGAAGLPFGAACTSDAQCASNACFIGGMKSFCSFHCTQATASTDCPVPPTTGACNNQGYCK